METVETIISMVRTFMRDCAAVSCANLLDERDIATTQDRRNRSV